MTNVLRVQATVEIEILFPEGCTGAASIKFVRDTLNQTERQLSEVLEACDNFKVVRVKSV
jgi:hypothetical protein